jgi:hypothetical protein
LLRRAVVGIIARQEDKIDPASHVPVHVVDDAAQIKVILQTVFGQMEIANVGEDQRVLVDQAGHGCVLDSLTRADTGALSSFRIR